MIRTGITSCVIVVLWISAIGMQTHSRTRHFQSILINPSMPGAFITFVKLGSRPPVFAGEGSSGIWLLMHNNYRVPIELPTYGVEKPGEVGMVYETIPAEPSASDNSRRHIDVSGMSRLDPGGTLLFSIPAEDLPKSAYLRIQFHFDGEESATKGGPAPLHFAVIYGTAIAEKSPTH